MEITTAGILTLYILLSVTTVAQSGRFTLGMNLLLIQHECTFAVIISFCSTRMRALGFMAHCMQLSSGNNELMTLIIKETFF